MLMSDFELKLKMKTEKIQRQFSILLGDQERIDMNGIYCNLILGFLSESANDSEKSRHYFETSFLKLQRVMP